jgi:alkaline phosphatase D
MFVRLVLALILGSTQFLSGQPEEKPYVLLVSFDGFRHDYVEKFRAENFRRFIDEGSSAEGLIPSFPSKTFPNHYTLVTGLSPGHHGIVDNNFYDPASGREYSMHNKETVTNPYFYNGQPIWNLVENQGMKSACLFWAGSEAPVNEKLPSYYMPYNKSMPDSMRIDRVIEWFRLDQSQRPNFVSLYFSLVDTYGHDYGTERTETARAVLTADALLGYLMNQLSTLDLDVNVVIVSDHGMLELPLKKESFLIIDELIEPGDTSIRVMNGGTHVHLHTTQVDSLYSQLQTKAEHFKVYRRQDFPVSWMYDSPRSGDLLLAADKGFYFRKHAFDPVAAASEPADVFGVHGYDATQVPEMQGIFYAKGPNIQSGMKIESFQNIHIYPFLAKLLGIDPPDTDGRAEVLAPLVVH